MRRMSIPDVSIEDWTETMQAMQSLESGEIANPDEGRQVGHYWLRNPSIAPASMAQEIQRSWTALEHLQEVFSTGYSTLLMVGIGGSALGPQLLVDALYSFDKKVRFLDNTDPEGIERVLSELPLSETLVAVLSKSGGTKETRNAMLEARAAFDRAGVSFSKRAIAVTVAGSALDQLATQEHWLAVLPLWTWVGGRTSITGMVGLLPLAFMGKDWRTFLNGADLMDQWTRTLSTENPALLMAHGWYCSGEGRGDKDLVVLPYKDSLSLIGRYLQQLIMESIGKKLDLSGQVVHQGLTVYGNKGSTDQHAFVQQLRDGPNDFFVNFIAVLREREGRSLEVEPGTTSGDYLLGFLMGTRNALTEVGKSSMSLILNRLSELELGALIALYERAVGLYASRININAYHQPGVEAGKKAAGDVLKIQQQILSGQVVSETDDTWLLRRALKINGRLV